eukprot:scaffold74191_cov72-Phaeocystis_antarctica.AAC.4
MISTAWVLSSSDDSGGASDVWRKAGIPRTREDLPSWSQSFSGTSREPLCSRARRRRAALCCKLRRDTQKEVSVTQSVSQSLPHS